MKTAAQKFVAKEKRILTPSGRLQQVAALVYRFKKDKLQILLITSRGTGRWVIPKGWPQVGRTLAETAACEAYEEAGIYGELFPHPIGQFDYCKNDLPPERLNKFTVSVFLLRFLEQAESWPERDQRNCLWINPVEAAERVDEEGLKEILRQFSAQHSFFATE